MNDATNYRDRCPAWCTADHSVAEHVDELDGDRLLHRHQFERADGVPVDLVLEEGPAGETVVALLAREPQLDAAGARRLAAALLDAADRMEATAS